MMHLENIQYRYRSDGFELRDIKLHIAPGEQISIVGPNGSGKTTLVKIMLGILKAKGEIRLVDKSLDEYTTKERARLLAYMPQYQALSYEMSVREYVELGRYPHTERFQGLTSSDHALVDKMLELTDAMSFANRSIQSLSGGERQRVFLAKALVQSPQILFLDEPITYLDLNQQLLMLRTVKEYCKNNNISVVAIMHDLNLALNFSDKVALMNAGELIDFGPPEMVLKPENIEKIFETNVQMLEVPSSKHSFIVPDLTF